MPKAEAAIAAPKSPIATKRFAIRSTRPAEQKEGNKIIFGTGEDVPFRHTCSLYMDQVDEKIFEYKTGLEPKHIEQSKHFTAEEKTLLLVQQEAARKILDGIYGREILRPTNSYFWEQHSYFKLDNETLGKFFDTKEPLHLLLYWKIMGGGYDDEIGPTYDAATAIAIPFYMTEAEEDAERESETINHKVKAFSLLEELNTKRSGEDMLWLAWILHPANMGYTKSTPPAVLYKAHYEFIEGLLTKKSKKSCPRQFIEAYNVLKVDKTRAITQALIRIADYFGLLFSDKDGILRMKNSDTQFGKNFEETANVLLKPANQEELEAFRNEVEQKIL